MPAANNYTTTRAAPTRSGPDHKEDDTVQVQLKDTYKLDTDARQDHSPWSIDAGISLTSTHYKYGGDLPAQAAQFSPFQVEQLIIQASSLLDRSIAGRVEWEELAARAFLQGSDLNQFLDLKKIYDKQVAADPGLYEWSAQQAREDATAENAGLQGALAVSGALKDVESYVTGKRSSMVMLLRRAANLAHLPTFLYNLPQQTGWQSWYWPPAEARGAYPPNEYPKDDKGNDEKPVEIFPNIASEIAARAQTEFTVDSQLKHLAVDEENAKAAISALTARQKAADVRARWEEVNKAFRQQQDEVINKNQTAKAAEAIKAGGAINLVERMNLVAARYERDLRDAIFRLAVATRGIYAIYGYDSLLPGQPEPSADFPQPGAIASREFHEACTKWARDAIGFLNRFAQFEQGIVHPLSVKSLLSDTEWKAGIAAHSWSFSFSEADLNAFWGAELYHVRLRGLSAFVSDNDPNTLWQINVRVPDLGQYGLLPDPVTGQKRAARSLDQQFLPACRFGRARSRASAQPPDVSGVVSLYNACPFGKWTLSIPPAALGGHDLSTVGDIQLDLHLVFQTPLAAKQR